MIEPPTNLTEKGDPNYPIFTQVSHHETTQLIDFYAEKQRMLERKDMQQKLSSIYEEKCNQGWRFAGLPLGEDPDDKFWYMEESEAEEEGETVEQSEATTAN